MTRHEPVLGGGFSSEVLTLETSDRVATLWLDRPEARNAMGTDLWQDLPEAMSLLSEDPEVRAVIVAAKGRDFSVGLDLKALFGGSGLGNSFTGAPGADGRPASMAARATGGRAMIRRLQAAITAVADCPKPVIAACHGYCIGGGVDLASACDIRLAASDAVFSVREAKMAIVADLGSLQHVPKIIGSGHTAELAFTGKDIDAEEACRIGLVNRVFSDPERLLAGARSLAEEIAANSPLAVQGTKAVLRAGEGRSVAEGLDYVATWNSAFLASDDLMEALTAFLEKRPPDFTGR